MWYGNHGIWKILVTTFYCKYLRPFLREKGLLCLLRNTYWNDSGCEYKNKHRCVGVCVHGDVCMGGGVFIYSHHLILGLAFFTEHTTSSWLQQEQFKPSGFSVRVYDPSNPLRALNCLSSDPCNVNITVFSTTCCYVWALVCLNVRSTSLHWAKWSIAI